MTILDTTGESDVVHLLNTIQELSEQIAQNRSLSIALHSSAGTVKNQASHSQTGFVLRRFNTDKPQDVYDAELERMNAHLMAENRGLLHDNKQLGMLIKEYEQTLESVMGAFRTKARDVQEHELALVREYEARLLAKESENLLRMLSSTIAESISLGRISAALRTLLRVLNGEEIGSPTPSPPGERESAATDPEFEFGEKEDGDWALERECELSRLERENAVLRRLLGLEVREPECLSKVESGGYVTDEQPRAPIPRPSEGTVTRKMLGGAPGTVGPYGTYKRSAAGREAVTIC